MDKSDQELMFGPAYYGDPGVPHGDPDLLTTIVAGYLFARAYKWAVGRDAARDHTSAFDHWLVAENSKMKRDWERLKKARSGQPVKNVPRVRDLSSARLPEGKWDRVMMSGHFHTPSFKAYPHDFVYPQEKNDRPSNIPHLVPPHREIPLNDFEANTLEEDEYVLKAMELVGNEDLAPGEEGFDEEDKLAFMKAKLLRKKLDDPANAEKAAMLDAQVEEEMDKDAAWEEEYVQAFSDIEEARLAFIDKVPLGLGEEFLMEKASQQLPPESVFDYTEDQLKGKEQIEMKKKVLANPRFDEHGEPFAVKERRKMRIGRIQAEAEKKREAYVQRVRSLDAKLDKLDAEAEAAEAAGDKSAQAKVAALERAERELQAVQDEQVKVEREVKEAIENFEDDEFVLTGKEKDPDIEWWERSERNRQEVSGDYYDEDDVEVAHRLHQKYAEKGGFDPIDAEFETDFTPEEQALIRFQDETPMYPTLGIMRGNANTLKRPQRLVDKSGVVFDNVDEAIRTHTRLTLDPTQDDPRFREWHYKLIRGKKVHKAFRRPREGEGSEINAPANEDFYPVITKPEPQLSSWFKQKMREGKPPIATEDDDITPWGEETSANADLASYVDRQLKVTGRKDDKETLKDLGIGWFTKPSDAERAPRGSFAKYKRKEDLAYELYLADRQQRKSGPHFKALSRSEAVDKYLKQLGDIDDELTAGEDKAPLPEFEEIPRYPGYLFASNGSGFGIAPSGEYVVALHDTNQLEAKTQKKVFTLDQLKKTQPGVDWDGELKALAESYGVDDLAPTKEERARILRQEAQRKYRERAARMKDLDEQDVEFLEASSERLRQRSPQEKRIGGRPVKDVYAQHRQFSPLSVWTFVNNLRSKEDTEKWNASDHRRRYDLETQGFVTEDAPKAEREHWADKLKLFGPRAVTALQRAVVQGDTERKKREDAQKGGWNMFQKAPREMLQPDPELEGGAKKGGFEIFGFRFGGGEKGVTRKPKWQARKEGNKEEQYVFFPKSFEDKQPARERGVDRSQGKPRRKEFMRDADIRYPRLRDDYGVHEPHLRQFVGKDTPRQFAYETDEDPVDPEFW